MQVTLKTTSFKCQLKNQNYFLKAFIIRSKNKFIYVHISRGTNIKILSIYNLEKMKFWYIFKNEMNISNKMYLRTFFSLEYYLSVKERSSNYFKNTL